MILPTLFAAAMALICVPDEPPIPSLIPIYGTGRKAVPGDRGEIGEEDTSGCVSAEALEEYLKAKKAGDQVGMAAFRKLKRGFPLPLGTKLLVIEPHLRKVRGMMPMSPERFDALYRAGAFDESSMPPESIEVRVLDGEHKDKALFVPVESVALLRPDEDIEARKRRAEDLVRSAAKDAAKAKLATPEARAASLLNVAKNLEKSGKVKPALENYRKVAKDFPGTPAAREAAGRVGALEGK